MARDETPFRKIIIAPKKPEAVVNTDITVSADGVSGVVERLPSLGDIQQSPDSTSATVGSRPDLSSIQPSPDSTSSIPKIIPSINTGISQSPDSTRTSIKQNPSINTGISQSPDSVNTSIRQPVNLDIASVSQSPDSISIITGKPSPFIDYNPGQVTESFIQTVKQQPAIDIGSVAVSEDAFEERAQIGMTGKWLPKGDPAFIGAENFHELQNFRYTDFGVELIGAASFINTTVVHASGINTAIQLTTPYNPASIVLAQTNQLVPVIKQNIAPIGAQGNFESTAVLTETSGAANARMTILPGNQVGICDDYADLMWAGSQMPIAAFLVGKNVSPTTNFIDFGDYTEKVKNTLTDSTNVVTVDGFYSASNYAVICSTRPLKGVTFDLSTVNDAITTIGGDNDVIRLRYDSGATQNIAVQWGDWSTTQLANTVDAAISLGLGGATIETGYASGKLYISAPAHTLELLYTSSDGANTLGFSGSQGPAATLTANVKLHRIIDVQYWNGTAYTTVGALTDGTEVSNQTMKQDGSVTWATTASVAQPLCVGGYSLYPYLMQISNGTTSIGNITVNADMQSRTNVWDGIYRTPLLAKFVRSTDGSTAAESFDMTTAMVVASSARTADATYAEYGMNFYYLAGSNIAHDDCYIELVFNEPIGAIRIVMWDTGTNNIIASPMRYWDGSSWQTGTELYDGTKVSTELQKTGVIIFSLNASYPEEQTTIDGIKGYAYRFIYSTSARPVETTIDLIQGIPRGGKPTCVHRFPFSYKNRAMWCGSVKDNELNRVDYSQSNAPDVYNGDDSSGYNNEQSIYFGNTGALTGTVELFNQYGNTIETIALFFKATETYMLTGDIPEEFKIFDISKSIGCPAPRTITSAEVSFKAADTPAQNVAIWLSDKGPMMFMGNTIRRIPGVENYFDQSDNANSIDIQYISLATAYFDPTYQEWNLIFPMGANGTITTNNKWITYDVVRDKWYEKKPTTNAIFPQGGFIVKDTYGNNYVYVYDNSGYIWELEQGSFHWYQNTSTPLDISGVVTTADFFFTESFWDRIRLRAIETIWGETDLSELDSAASVAIQYYRDASVNPTVTLQAAKTMDLANYRLRHLINDCNYVGWSHRLKYTVTHPTAKVSFYGIGMRYQKQFDEKLDEDYHNYSAW